MPNPFGVPEITVAELSARIADGKPGNDTFVWLDVREPNEHAAVRIEDERIELVPLSQLAAQQLSALPNTAMDKDAEIVVMCHHGVRSAQVVAWLSQQGWTNTINLAGGIDAWAKEVDASIGTY